MRAPSACSAWPRATVAVPRSWTKYATSPARWPSMWRATRGSGRSTVATSDVGACACAAGAHASAPSAARMIDLRRRLLRITGLGAFCNGDEAFVRLVEGQPALPFGVEGDLQRRRERRVLDDDHGQVGAAEDRVLHAEHDVALVDDHELQRELGNEARLLACVDEGADARGSLRV